MRHLSPGTKGAIYNRFFKILKFLCCLFCLFFFVVFFLGGICLKTIAFGWKSFNDSFAKTAQQIESTKLCTLLGAIRTYIVNLMFSCLRAYIQIC